MRDLISSIRSWLRRRAPMIAGPDEEFSLPFTAREDFEVGDKLIFIGDSLYRWRREYRVPAAFLARRKIRAGGQVRYDPLDPRRSDVITMWWDVSIAPRPVDNSP